MELPKLPFWFYAGRVPTPVRGPVFVLKYDGDCVVDIIEAKDSVVLTPRMRFFATSQSVSQLAKKKLVKRLKDPKIKFKEPEKEPEKAKASEGKEAPPAAPPAQEPPKSEPDASATGTQGAPSGGSSGSNSEDAVIPSSEEPSGSGDGEAGSSAPKETESKSAKSGRKKKAGRS